MSNKHYPTGLDNRNRDHDGGIRKKRSDTKVETLRKIYDREYVKDYTSDIKLGTVLKNERAHALDELIKKGP